jgi:hypothetical protein
MNVYQGALEVILPLDLAIIYAAEQNFSMDMQRNLVSGPERWQYDYKGYLQEAYELLVKDRQNYLPYDESYPLIKLCEPIGKQEVETERCLNLLQIFHCYYRNSERVWAIRPEPTVIKDASTINSYLEFMTEHFDPPQPLINTVSQ